MPRRIDLYRLEVGRLKSIIETAEELARALELPEDALLGSAKLTVTAGRRAMVENHRGILAYADTRIVIRLPRGRLALSGSDLRLLAMTSDSIFIGGHIQNVEWE